MRKKNGKLLNSEARSSGAGFGKRRPKGAVVLSIAKHPKAATIPTIYV
jgi:hypothetical protein